MIAAIPTEDSMTVNYPKAHPVPVTISITVRCEDPAEVVRRVRAKFGPLTCLSCGAKTNSSGELPCGH